jgi:DNA-binding IclR family transcriptional regulator
MADYRVPALERAFQIIDMLERSSLGLTKTDIAKRLSLPYSSIFNLLNTLEVHGYARKDDETGKYYIGPRLMHGDRLVSDESVLRRVAVPVMRELIVGTSLTSHLAVLRGGDAVYIEKQEPNGFFRLNTWVGQRVYVHTSAVGKALVCELAKLDVQDIWKRGLPSRTPKTVTSFRAFWSELRRTRERGYALDDEEDQIGGRCVAVPVRAASGAVVAALGVSAVTHHLPSVQVDEVAQRLLRAVSGFSPFLAMAGRDGDTYA